MNIAYSSTKWPMQIQSSTSGANSAIQVISVLKSLVENGQMPRQTKRLAPSVDLRAILHVLVVFISRFNDPISYRIRIKWTLQKDDLSRNRILGNIMKWFQDPLLNMEADAQIQYSLDITALQSIDKLLDCLKQQYIGTNRLFIRYSHVLLRALEIRQSEHLTSDIVSDVPAVKKMQALQRRLTKRTIFVHVVARVSSKDTRFELPGNPELQARRNRLRELVKWSDVWFSLSRRRPVIDMPADDPSHGDITTDGHDRPRDSTRRSLPT
ncbi:hypothetical protein BU15DRAFT_75052 [Melanogaster broomeanus]|nr:hypothetical protein BU15DRAFT_75052 [Melanogaster broomeanus]